MNRFYYFKKQILNYFPPVTPKKYMPKTMSNIPYEYDEMVFTYNKFEAINPLIELDTSKDEMYSPDIIQNLQTLRKLLNSNINNERFMYELNLLVKSYGEGGYFDKSILKKTLVSLICKLNNEYVMDLNMKRMFLQQHLSEEMNKEKEFNNSIRNGNNTIQNQQDLMQHAQNITYNYQLDQLSDDFSNIGIKFRAPKPKLLTSRGIKKGKDKKDTKPFLDLSSLTF